MNRQERGSLSVETLIIFPVLATFLLLVAAAGWQVGSRMAVSSAANAAARAASMARDADEADEADDRAHHAARAALDGSDLRCRSTPAVDVDTAGFAVPTGELSTVSVTVTCEVKSVLGVPGLGPQTVTATGSSVLDTFRGR